MDNLINALQGQVDCQAVNQTCRTSTEESKGYSTLALLDAYEKDVYIERLWEDLY